MDPFLGLINAFGFNFAPYQWAVCGGQVLPLRQYTALFALLGVQYGGDGVTTFGLPNLNSRAAVGAGPDGQYFNYEQGSTGGAESVVLSPLNLPMHSHNVSFSINGSSASAVSTQTAAGGYPANVDDGSSNNFAYAPAATQGQYMASMPVITIGPAGSGSGGSIGIRQPYLAINYCIALSGVFPTRG